MDALTEQRLPRPARWRLAMLGVAATAFGMRLVPVLNGGGLFGRGNYDDGVYYAAAVGFVHGLMPYRDFLLLHPPGIVLALSPFATLAGSIGDPDGFAVARVAFMVLGAANAVLVGVALRPLGLVAATVGAAFYAVFYPAVYVEHTTLLEPLQTTCLLGSVVLLTGAVRPADTFRGSRITMARVLAAGVLMGFSASLKIWGVVPALAILGWVLVVLGWRRALPMAGGALAGATAVCLPFFWAAPTQMWHLVVVSQLGRPRSSVGWLDRAATIAGIARVGSAEALSLAAAVGVLACSCVAACRSSVGRLAVVVLLASVGLLFATPSWFPHYAALTAGPIALVVGSATGWAVTHIRRPVTATVAGALTLGVLATFAGTVLTRPFGAVFPTSALTAVVAAAPGCVTTDDPISLIELDVLQRNLDRRCPLVVDLGGYNYALHTYGSQFMSRATNPQWQAMALDYLRNGDISIVGFRFRRGVSFSAATANAVSFWPVLAEVGKVTARRPSEAAKPG